MSCKACQASNPLGNVCDVSVLIKLTQLKRLSVTDLVASNYMRAYHNIHFKSYF